MNDYEIQGLCRNRFVLGEREYFQFSKFTVSKFPHNLQFQKINKKNDK